ncbi:MAG: nickel-dependent lactate racemase [Anaerolineae bacterium]
MMRVHLGGHLSWYDPQKRAWLDVPVQAPITLLALAEHLGVPAGEIAVVSINRRIAELETDSAYDGDTVEFFPAIGGGSGRDPVTTYRLPYGKTYLEFTLPERPDWTVQVLAPRAAPAAADPLAEVERALDLSPIPRPDAEEGVGPAIPSAPPAPQSWGESPDDSQVPPGIGGLGGLIGVVATLASEKPTPVDFPPAPSEMGRTGGGGQRARCAIAVNDKTHPVPHQYLLPPLLARLAALGISPEQITLLIATGTHAAMPPEEFQLVIPPEILSRGYRVVSHNCDDEANLVYLGKTARGTPVWVNRLWQEADLRIVVGNIEPHQFMGFSGGVKSAAVGLTGRATINTNHAMMTAAGAQINRYDDNPCRQDVEEIGRMIGVHYALNTILNDHKQIVHVLAGPPVEVMRRGIPLLRAIYQVTVSQPFDLMIVSPGGHPKDINLYQAQKALGHATLVMKPGGTVILAAACPEGTGSQGYEAFMADPAMTNHLAVLARYAQEGYRIGPHKAWQISRDASRVRLIFVSDMAPDFARRLLLNPIADRPGMTPQAQLAAALARALADLPAQAQIGIMPLANATIPVLTSMP